MPVFKKIDEAAKEFWNDLETEPLEKQEFLFEKIITARSEAGRRYLNAHYFFLAFCTLEFILISNSAKTSEIEFLGLKIIESNVQVIEWIITTILCFVHYQGLTAQQWDIVHFLYVDEYFKKHFSSLKNSPLPSLISPPSFLNYEHFLLAKKHNIFSFVFTFITYIGFMVVPLGIISSFMCSLLMNGQGFPYPSLRIFIILVDVFFIIRSMSLMAAFNDWRK